MSSSQWTETLRHDVRDTSRPNLSAPSSFQRLDLSANKLGDEGVMTLLDCIRDPIGLRMLDLHSTGCSDVVVDVVKAVLKSNHDLCILDVRGNNIALSALNAIGDRLTQLCKRHLKSVGMESARLSSWIQLSDILGDPDYEVLSSENPLLKSYHQTFLERPSDLAKPSKALPPKPVVTPKTMNKSVTVKKSAPTSVPAKIVSLAAKMTKVDYKLWELEHDERVKLESRCTELEGIIAHQVPPQLPKVLSEETLTDHGDGAYNETVKLMQDSLTSFHLLLDRLEKFGIVPSESD